MPAMSTSTRAASRTHRYRRASSDWRSRSTRVGSDRSCIAWRRPTSCRRSRGAPRSARALASREQHQQRGHELRLAAASWELRLGRARRHGDLLVETLPLSLLDRNDVPPERTERDRDQFEVRETEGDPDDCQAQQYAGDQMADDQPPTGEQEPEDVP